MIKTLLMTLALTGSTHFGTVWQIGIQDGSTEGFALAPDGYAAYIEKDFGWEDRYFLVGVSDPGTDFPYILPGPADAWGGTSVTAGIRTHVQNILFDLEEAGGDAELIMDFAAVNDSLPPLLKVTVNGLSFKKIVDTTTWAFPVGDVLHKGSNAVRIETLEGSWLTFDDIRLEGAGRLSVPSGTAWFKGAEAADYRTAESVQPLLVNVLHLSGRPEMTVLLDEQEIYRKVLERGEYLLEVPMPAVDRPQESRFEIRFDGQTAGTGKALRAPCPVVTPADYVDTYLGSAHSRWMLAPGPWAPFGMVKLAPDNQNSGWQAGYDPSFESIGTFSHVHEWTMAGLGTMPANGPLKTLIGDQSERADRSDAYRSGIDKASEICKAGYYSVRLTDYDILAELTATARCGFQRYTFPPDRTGRVMIDLKIPAEYHYDILRHDIRQTGPRRIEGWSAQETNNVWSSDADQYYTLHFILEFDHDIAAFGQGGEFLYYAEFDTSDGRPVQLRSAISYVDPDGARNNLLKEITEPFGWDFEAVRAAQKEAWNDILSRVQVETDDRQQKVRFYTNLYRCFCRNLSSDADGRWRDAAGQIQRTEGADGLALGGDAFWNTFWNLNPLWNLVTPEWSSRWVRSELSMYRSGGWLAKGPAGMKYIPVMVAEHEIPMMVGAWQMGIRDYDGELLFEAVKKMQMTPAQKVGRGFAGNRDLAEYLRFGYVPSDRGRFSNTMEYAFDDWTVSQLALAMGKEDDYRYFADRGSWWRHAIDPESGYCRMRRSDGSWERDFDPFRSGANEQYVEGNAWQLTYFVPQDVERLADLIGRRRFSDRLEWGFGESEKWRYNAPGDQYWDFPVVQGNQQSMHFAYLFNYIGKPWLTQRWSRSIVDRYYGFHASDAWLGDEDQGQMSAWLVMTSLGLFQTDGGCRADPYFELTGPSFSRVTLDLRRLYGRGGTFIIEAENASRENIYIQSALLNGRPLDTFKVPASEILQRGTLTLRMGPGPSDWGTK